MYDKDTITRHIRLAIFDHWVAYEYGPSLRDIQRIVNNRLDISTGTATLRRYLSILKDEGVVNYEDNISRTFRLTSMRIRHE